MPPSEHQKTITLKELHGRQPLVGIPIALTKELPKRIVAEFDQLDATTLRLRVVDEKTVNQSTFKRYDIVRHSGTNWTSIPKPWLRDIGAKGGDVINVMVDGPHSLVLQFRRTE